MRIRFLAKLVAGLAALIVVAVVFAFSLGTTSSQVQSQNSGNQELIAENDRACLTCHNDPIITAIYNTPHGNATVPSATSLMNGCSSCHGDSTNHARSVSQSPGIVFGEGSALFSASDADVQNQTCTNCHQSMDEEHGGVNPSQFDNLICVTCHTIHDS